MNGAILQAAVHRYCTRPSIRQWQRHRCCARGANGTGGLKSFAHACDSSWRAALYTTQLPQYSQGFTTVFSCAYAYACSCSCTCAPSSRPSCRARIIPQMLCWLWPHSSIIPDCIIAHQAFLKGVGLFLQKFIYHFLVLSHYCTNVFAAVVVTHLEPSDPTPIVWLLCTRLRANHALQ